MIEALIPPPPWYDPSYSAPGILDISPVTGNQMDVQVHDALAGIFSAIYSDVIAVRMVLLVQNLFGFIQQLAQGPAFFGCGGKEVRDMAFADDQHMPRGHRVFIIFDPGQVVFYKQVFPLTEDTIFHSNTSIIYFSLRESIPARSGHSCGEGFFIDPAETIGIITMFD